MSSENNASPKIVDNMQRRTLIKGAAWAAPVIAVAAAAPAYAASGDPIPAPAGISLWENSLNVATSEANRTVGTGTSYVRFDVYPDGQDEDAAAPGTYTIGAPVFTLSWSGSGSYEIDLENANLRGWVAQPPVPAAGNSGSLSFVFGSPLANGMNQRLPSVNLKPTQAAPPILPSTTVTFAIQGTMGSLGPASASQVIN